MILGFQLWKWTLTLKDTLLSRTSFTSLCIYPKIQLAGLWKCLAWVDLLFWFSQVFQRIEVKLYLLPKSSPSISQFTDNPLFSLLFKRRNANHQMSAQEADKPSNNKLSLIKLPLVSLSCTSKTVNTHSSLAASHPLTVCSFPSSKSSFTVGNRFAVSPSLSPPPVPPPTPIGGVGGLLLLSSARRKGNHRPHRW